MEFLKDQRISGFRVTEIRESAELCGKTIRMEHEKTGAELFFTDNGAENMVFCITFRTLPEDSTGVFHILEHSVLCGSERYPVKEPFVELLKSSMNTFLNAMTFPDMTMYPVSSRNRRDLMNLAGVYLDAVFAPLSIKDRKRFDQEGWHIDRNEDGEPVYKGVVFNEMKGSMSDTDNLIDRQLERQLFPDTCYGFNSGGDPEVIPTLSWGKYREQYERHYHPSNAKVYLDGNVPMEEMLPLIDSYFSRYEKREDLPEFKWQQPKGSEETIFYELAQDESAENRGHLTLAHLTGTWRDRADNTAMGIICDVLAGTNESPLKRAVLEAGLAEDLSVGIDDTVLQSWVTIHAENVTDGKEEEIRNLLREQAAAIAKDGLDRDAVEASLNRALYHMREEDEPQGIGRCIRCMGSWLYGGDPTDALENKNLAETLKEYLDSGRFNELAADMLTEKEYTVILHSRPSHTLGEEKRREEEERLKEITGAWSEADREENEKEIEALEAWQQTPDRPEDLAKLPKLTKEDAEAEPEWTETETSEFNGVTVLSHRLNCNGVVHLRAYFALTDYTLEELTRLSQVTGLFMQLPTQKHDTLKLQQEIKRQTGGMGFVIMTHARAGQDDTCTPYLAAYTSALEEKADKAQELLAEILTSTRFEDARKMTEIFRQNELSARQRIVSAGHLIGLKNVLSHYSADGAVKNALDGNEAARYIHTLAKEPEKELPGLQKLAERLMGQTLCRKRMTVSVTSTEPRNADILISAFPEGAEAPAETAYHREAPKAVGFRIPAGIGFAVRGYRLSRTGKAFEGSMWLAGSILTLGYLWNKIRVQGGAYGAGMQVDRAGNIFFYSYRDPTPARTLEAAKGAADFLREFAEQGEESLDQFIISSLNELNPLLSPRDRGALADGRFMSEYTREEAERIRKQILHATPADLIRCGEWLERFSEESAVCVVAHNDALKECRGLEISDL